MYSSAFYIFFSVVLDTCDVKGQRSLANGTFMFRSCADLQNYWTIIFKDFAEVFNIELALYEEIAIFGVITRPSRNMKKALPLHPQ